jgi:hypothetical protein
MSRLNPSAPRLVVPVLVVLALLGFLAGHHRAQRSSADTAGSEVSVTTASGIQLDYPADWQPAKSALPIPGLPIADPLVLSPAGDSTEAGLISGQILPSQTSPLPVRLLSHLRAPPATQVVNVGFTQAYRYSRLSIPGYAPALILYVLPNTGNGTTAVACYAATADSAYMKECEQIVTSVSVTGQSADELTPDSAYAGQLDALIEGLDSTRATLRREMGVSTTTGKLANLSMALAERYTSAAATLSKIKAPAMAGPAQAALANALVGTDDAYRALAAAASTSSATGGRTAEIRIGEAENNVNATLESFTLLGYSRS